MGFNVKVDTVRHGVSLMKGLLREADAQGNWNNKVSSKEVNEFKQSFGDGAELDKAIDAVHAYAQARYKTASPSVDELGRALYSAMRNIAKADTNKSGFLTDAEIDKGANAKTWRALVDFSKAYRDTELMDVVRPASE
jgi:hypothetical protein